MSYRQDQRAQSWAREIERAGTGPDNEQARFTLGWKIMEIEEERNRYKWAVQALDAALGRDNNSDGG